MFLRVDRDRDKFAARHRSGVGIGGSLGIVACRMRLLLSGLWRCRERFARYRYVHRVRHRFRRHNATASKVDSEVRKLLKFNMLVFSRHRRRFWWRQREWTLDVTRVKSRGRRTRWASIAAHRSSCMHSSRPCHFMTGLVSFIHPLVRTGFCVAYAHASITHRECLN
jgi:hypothetical protein